MQHPKLVEWEKKLKAVFDCIDAELEKKYGSRYPLHPARPEHGATANPEQSGLFNIGASFTAGFGSALGPGYVVEVRMATLAEVPAEVREQIEAEVVEKLRARLPALFPGRELKVERDGHNFKIHGDLSLGLL